MAKGFTLSMLPWVYLAQYQSGSSWVESFQEKPHLTPAQEEALSEDDRASLLNKRNSFPELPLVNFTTQYGMGCFEGLKAFPQKDGGIKLFRPAENAKRMHQSMQGLMMPAFPPELFTRAAVDLTRRNHQIGFTPAYDPDWAKDDFVSGHSVYIRPFTYAEPGIGLGLSHKPWVVMVQTPVGSYFSGANSKAITTDQVRATPGGTGWIKCDANYVIPTLVKKRAEQQGYMEAIFLDSVHKQNVEEGSSCNIFFVLESGKLVTPALGDTILPGINRKSVVELAPTLGVEVEERAISIAEVMDQAKEAFVTGTAAGVAYLESITHNGKIRVLSGGKMGPVTRNFLTTLKGIQYGAIEDKFGWMVGV